MARYFIFLVFLTGVLRSVHADEAPASVSVSGPISIASEENEYIAELETFRQSLAGEIMDQQQKANAASVFLEGIPGEKSKHWFVQPLIL